VFGGRLCDSVEREEQRAKLKRRMFANINFIGELYKIGMLTPNIMHFCITTVRCRVRSC
jgi:hypothetical protein